MLSTAVALPKLQSVYSATYTHDVVDIITIVKLLHLIDSLLFTRYITLAYITVVDQSNIYKASLGSNLKH